MPLGIQKRMLAAASQSPARKDASPIERPRKIEELFRQHADFVWRVLRRHGLSAADAEDALQEVFLVVHRRLSDYEERGSSRAWLFAISRQVAAHHHRAAARSERRIRAFQYDDTSHRTPQRALECQEAADLVNEFLAEIGDTQGTVFHLIEIEGMTAPEVAAATGANLNTVYARLRLARKRFEKLVRERWEASES